MDLTLTQDMSIIAVLTFGFLLGLKHAVEADHLAAVSTIVAERKNAFSSAIVGGFWGVGHTVSLLLIGAAVILLKVQISETVEARLEAVVGVMLIVLGANAIRKLVQKSEIHIHRHDHDGHEHTHIHAHGEEQKSKNHHFVRLSPRSILIGMVHGLAGSAALMLLIVPTISSPIVALAYILIFGVGSVLGMMLMSLILGLPLHLTAGKFDLLNKGILAAAGLFSFGLGALIVYEKLLI